MRLGNRTISIDLAVLRSVAQTFSLRLIGHKLKVCATTHLRSSYVTEVESYRDRHRGQLTWNWLGRLTEVEETLPPVKMFNSGIPLSEINL